MSELPGEEWGYRVGLRIGMWLFPKLPPPILLWLAKRWGKNV